MKMFAVLMFLFLIGGSAAYAEEPAQPPMTVPNADATTGTVTAVPPLPRPKPVYEAPAYRPNPNAPTREA